MGQVYPQNPKTGPNRSGWPTKEILGLSLFPSIFLCVTLHNQHIDKSKTLCNRGRPGRRSLGVMLHGLPMQRFESIKHLTYHNRLWFVKSWIDSKASVLLFVWFDPPTGRFPTSINGRFVLNLFLSDPQKWPGKVESKINLPKMIGRSRMSYFHGSLI